MRQKGPFSGEERETWIKVSEWLLEKGVSTVYNPKGFKRKRSGYVFSGAGVDVMLTENKNLETIQRDIQKKTAAEKIFCDHALKGDVKDD